MMRPLLPRAVTFIRPANCYNSYITDLQSCPSQPLPEPKITLLCSEPSWWILSNFLYQLTHFVTWSGNNIHNRAGLNCSASQFEEHFKDDKNPTVVYLIPCWALIIVLLSIFLIRPLLLRVNSKTQPPRWRSVDHLQGRVLYFIPSEGAVYYCHVPSESDKTPFDV